MFLPYFTISRTPHLYWTVCVGPKPHSFVRPLPFPGGRISAISSLLALTFLWRKTTGQIFIWHFL